MKNKILLLMACLATSGTLVAEDYVPIGAKGLGMSGAQTANPEGSQAILTNPAALGRKDQNRFDIALPITVTLGSQGTIIEDADTLFTEYDQNTSGRGIQQAFNNLGNGNPTLGDVNTINTFLTTDAAVLNKTGQGISAQVQGALTARIKQFGISVGTRTYAAGTVFYDSQLPIIPTDQNDVNFITELQSAATQLTNNKTGVEVRGLMTKEAAFSYGFSFMEDKLHVAPVVKFIQGETRQSSVLIFDSTDTDIGDELTEERNTKSTTTFGFDLGLLYQPHPKWTLGLVGRDLNTPSFDLWNGKEIELNPAVRGGAAFEFSQKPGWRGLATLDFDVLKNESTLLVGHDSQQVAFGLSQELMGFLSLRAGVAQDMASESSALSYSVGLGLQLYRFYLDVAGAISSETVSIDGDDFPTRGGVGVTIGWNQNL